MNCERCDKAAFATTCSWFNTEQICLECAAEEKKDPRYEEARKTESEAVRRGDFNFPGIGR